VKQYNRRCSHNSTFSLRFAAVWKRRLRRCFFILANGQNVKWCQIGTVERTEKNLSLPSGARNACSGNVLQEQLLMVTASNLSMPFAQENELHFTLLRLSTIQYRRHCSNDAEQMCVCFFFGNSEQACHLVAGISH
jgi:hypothetical protein